MATNRPTNPTSLTTSPSGSVRDGSTIRIKWNDGSDPDGDNLTYSLYADYTKLNGQNESVELYRGGGNEYAYTIPTNKYKSAKYRISCYDTSGVVASGYTYTGVIQIIANTRPINPTSLTTSPSGSVSVNSSITISWNAGSDPDGDSLTYRLLAEYIKTDGGTEPVPLYTGSNRTYTHTIPANKYRSVRYKIDCTDSKGSPSSDYTYSDTVNIINNRPPNRPTSLTTSPSGSVIGGSGITISWNAGSDPDGDSLTYDLYAIYTTLGGSIEEEMECSGSSTAFTYTIPFGNKYKSVQYAIECRDSRGGISLGRTYSNSIQIIANNRPINPTSLTTSPSGSVSVNSSITISWNAGSDPDGDSLNYRLYADYTKMDWQTESYQLYNGSGRSYTHTIPANKYRSVQYRIDCTDSNGTGSLGSTYSSPVNIINNRPPTNPVNINVNMDSDFRVYNR